MSSYVEFKVRCDELLAQAVTAAVADWRAVEAQWWEQAGTTLIGLPAKQRPVAQRWLQADFELLRDQGQLRGSVAGFLRPALVAELERRRWLTRRWQPVPPGERSRKGRPWGTPDRKFNAAFKVFLPADIGDRLVRACYWTSLPAVQQLQALADATGDYGINQRGTGSGYRPHERRAQLVGQIITPAEVLRIAADNAVEAHSEARPAPVEFAVSTGTR